jgi:prephenate dehydrogenase
LSQSRLALLGIGLIGGSIALGVRARGRAVEVVGYDPDPGTRERAADIVDRVTDDPAAAVKGADLVVLAVPVDRIPAACERLAEHVGPDAIVTDVGSAKVAVVAAGERFFEGRFVGGHPMAGSERHGIGAADGALFDDAWWILTPTALTSSDAYARVASFASDLGSRPVAVDPNTHDALVARLSHVPQLAASALVDVAAKGGDRDALLELAAGGFRDVTRIAASDPSLWVAILRSNRPAVLEALGRVTGALEDAASLIRDERWDDLAAWLDDARRARLELFAKPVMGAEPVALAMLVPDRPGVLAEVTTAAGRLGANIEDLRIIHSTEGGRGRLELVIAGHDAAAALAEALSTLGYRVELASDAGLETSG